MAKKISTKKTVCTTLEGQCLIWDYYKPRHTHSWNMLVHSWQELDSLNNETDEAFNTEYCWENFILRLWLYRTTVKTLTKIKTVEEEASAAINIFDTFFDIDGQNALKQIRDMIEHFDDYAANIGRGFARRERDLDPWRWISKDQYERGIYCLERNKTFEAFMRLHSDAKLVSHQFIQWYKSSE